MVIVYEASDKFDDFTLITVSMGYNIIPSRIHQYSQIYTNLDDNSLPCHQYVPRFFFPGIILSFIPNEERIPPSILVGRK
jgi:hypothetical protein